MVAVRIIRIIRRNSWVLRFMGKTSRSGLEKEINFGYKKTWLKNARPLYCEDVTMDIVQWVEIFLDPEAFGAREKRRLETDAFLMED
jgi:hypothetical protein